MTRMLLALVILSLSVTVALARHLMHNTPIDGAESLRTSEKRSGRARDLARASALTETLSNGCAPTPVKNGAAARRAGAGNHHLTRLARPTGNKDLR